MRDEEWGKSSDREIARRCGVGNKFVGDVRKSICVPNTDGGRTVSRNGATYTQDVTNIGHVRSEKLPVENTSGSEVEIKGDDGELDPIEPEESATLASVESALPEILAMSQGEQSSDDCPVEASVIKQIPISLVLELLEVAYPEELREHGEDNTPIFACCPIPRSWWDEAWYKTWEQCHRPAVESFNELAQQVNLCLWQIDNTFAIAQTHDVYSVGGRLAEYGLLVMDEDSTLPATAKQLASWMVSNERQYDSIQEVVRDALAEQRFDILKPWK